jgi:hypothetical protein
MAFVETAAGRLPPLKHHLQFVRVNRRANFTCTIRTVYGYV